MRGWSERVMNPASFGLGRQNMHQNAQNMGPMGPMPGMNKQMAPMPTQPQPDAPIYYSFNIPFASELAGPNVQDILYSTSNEAVVRWTHPSHAADDVPVHELPFHTGNLAALRRICDGITQGPLPVEAEVITTVSEKHGLITTVVLYGSTELVYKSRQTILNDLPHSTQCTTVDVDANLVCNMKEAEIKSDFTEHLEYIAQATAVDIFLLGPKPAHIIEALSSEIDMGTDHRWRVAIYGNTDAVEHAKTRVLIYIDKMLGRMIDTVMLESTNHLVCCGRNKKNIKIIESETGTAIYFPPPYTPITNFQPSGTVSRSPNEVYITGSNLANLQIAKHHLIQLASGTRVFPKEVGITPAKIDSMLLTHVSKIRKILETNGTYLSWPCLGSQRHTIHVQGSDNTIVDKTVKDIMGLAGQFYSASWWIQQLDPRTAPPPHDVRLILGGISAESGADILFEKSTFTLTGFDDSVKEGLRVMSNLPFFTPPQYQIKVKIELANEHKEFVSGKKNGKINKIMGQSNVQIMFDGFNDWNFNIDVNATNYTQLKHGLDLVEAEMPASISFHVPDQYHKRIIGIGGQHIQRIMKKHSVFVKFSNAMDRGGLGREDDDVKVDNVICRTPARNAQNLDLVKTEILGMVDQDDSELTTQTVNVDRLFHRTLLTRLKDIEELEKQWNCKCSIPSSEHASDEIMVKGPEWRVPHFIDSLLSMIPDKHELILAHSPELAAYLASSHFKDDVKPFVKRQYEVDLDIVQNSEERTEDGKPTVTIRCTFTRNNAGAIRDAQSYLQDMFAEKQVRATFVKGYIERPRSHTFSTHGFDSKLLLPIASEPPESPARSTFGEEQTETRSKNFAQISRKLCMMSAGFLGSRKNSSQSTTLFKGSANVSKTSLISLESARSFNIENNPWNDSGICVNKFEEDDHLSHSIWAAPRPLTSTGASSLAGSMSVPGNSHGNCLGNGLDLPKFHTSPNGAQRHGATPGDVTPRHNPRPSGDSGRPSTSNSLHSGYPGAPFVPFRN